MTQYIAENVEILFPKIHAPFRFDSIENHSVQCQPLEEGAKYEVNFKYFPAEKADELKALMKKEWGIFKQQNPTAEFKNIPFKASDDGGLIFKTQIKAAYSGEKTKPPAVYDHDNQRITDPEFRLTTGSVGNVAFTLVPYSTGVASGVSLRLRAVQVLELNEDGGGESPFGPPKSEFNQDDKAKAQGKMVSDQLAANAAAAKADSSDPFADLEDEAFAPKIERAFEDVPW